MSRLLLVLILSLAPVAALAQPPPRAAVVVSQRQRIVSQRPVLTAPSSPKKIRPNRSYQATKSRSVRSSRARILTRPLIHHPSPLHLLSGSLQGLPPPVPSALLNQKVDHPHTLRQLQFQLDLLHVRSPR